MAEGKGAVMAEAAKSVEAVEAVSANDNALPRGARDGLWYTTAEAAVYLRMKPGAVKSLVFRGSLIPDRRGGNGVRSHRFHRDTLDAYFGRKNGTR